MNSRGLDLPAQRKPPWHQVWRQVLRVWMQRRLGFRLSILLTVALLPLGILAFEQTKRLQSEVERVRLLNFHAVTAEIARREASTTARAAGVARALSDTLPRLADTSPEGCSSLTARIVERSSGTLTFVGFVPRNGYMRCNSTRTPRDFSSEPGFSARVQEPRTAITTSPRGRVSEVPVITIFDPAYNSGGVFVGYTVVSLGVQEISLPDGASGRDVSVAVVSENGEVLGATHPVEALQSALPERLNSTALSGQASFARRDRSGTMRDYAVEPIVAGTVYALGMRQDAAGTNPLGLPAAFYPLGMWIASVALVLIMLELSLIGPVRGLIGRIRRFGESREFPRRPPDAPAMPAEIAEIEDSFAKTAMELNRDEQRLVAALRDQKVLLKEVHHRVKNNLQIISSMINLQMRGAEAAETRSELGRISIRIASLATIHRRLYEAEHVGSLRFDELLQELVEHLLQLAQSQEGASSAALPRMEYRLAPLTLSPNEALTASMLAVEAVTNALKHSAPDSTGRHFVRVTLEAPGAPDAPARMSVESSGLGPAAGGDGSTARLGSRLIAGFARQLGGTTKSGWDGEAYIAQLSFVPSPERSAEAAQGNDIGGPEPDPRHT